MKAYRSEMISKQLKRIIQGAFLQKQSVFDLHNFQHGCKLHPEDINIVKIMTHKGIRSSTVYYFIDSENINDKNFIIFNKYRFLPTIKKMLKTRTCPNIVFKYDSNYVNNVMETL